MRPIPRSGAFLGLAGALALALLLPAMAHACSQCLCGNPTPAGLFLNAPKTAWSYGFEDQYMSKANAMDDGSGEESQIEHHLAAQVAWRPLSALMLRLKMPFVFKSNTQRPPGEAQLTTRSHGLGDAELLARYDLARFYGLLLPTGALSAVLATSVPTGSNEAVDAEGERLDAHLQPGTGAWGWTGGLAVDRQALRGAVNGSLLARVNTTNSHGYHYGDAVLFNAGYARTLGPSWEGAIELNGRWAALDRTEDGGTDPNTGGGVLYLSPSLQWSGVGPVALNALAQLPVARQLNGIQTEKPTLRLALAWVSR